MAYSNNLYDTPVIRDLFDAMPHLSASQRKIAVYILEHIFDVATGGIEDLAVGVGVSTASVSRFVASLDYSSFSAFKQALLQAFKPPFAARKDGLPPGPLGAASLSFRQAETAIHKAEQLLHVENLGHAVDLISQARTVYCMALGSSLPIANIASLCLAPYCNHIQLVNGGGELAVIRLNKICEKDLFIIFSFPRYSIDSVRVTQFVKGRNASVLAVTDQPRSPFVPLSNLALYVQAEHSTVPVSLVGSVAIVEALTSALAERFPEKFSEFSTFSREFVPFHYFKYPGVNADKGGE